MNEINLTLGDVIVFFIKHRKFICIPLLLFAIGGIILLFALPSQYPSGQEYLRLESNVTVIGKGTILSIPGDVRNGLSFDLVRRIQTHLNSPTFIRNALNVFSKEHSKLHELGEINTHVIFEVQRNVAFSITGNILTIEFTNSFFEIEEFILILFDQLNHTILREIQARYEVYQDHVEKQENRIIQSIDEIVSTPYNGVEALHLRLLNVRNVQNKVDNFIPGIHTIWDGDTFVDVLIDPSLSRLAIFITLIATCLLVLTFLALLKDYVAEISQNSEVEKIKNAWKSRKNKSQNI
ncbi:MAG: hypothetical protein ACR2PY_02440 [Salinispira sp.]